MRYLPDTNVMIDALNDAGIRRKLERPSLSFAIAPSTMTELTVGVVKGGEKYFAKNREIFGWLKTQTANILDLTRPFMGKILGFPSKNSDVETEHHVQRISLVADSTSFSDFLKRKDAQNSVWTDIDNAD